MDNVDRAKTKNRNEAKFYDFFVERYGSNSLQGKRVYKAVETNVQISVDQSFENDELSVLVEVDSMNMAKLLVGQYALLNVIGNLKKPTVFLVVHFYKGYNPQRTGLNLGVVSSGCSFSSAPLAFLAVTFTEFRNICSNQNTVDSLISEIARRATLPIG